jgi:hypothetical protein
VDLFDPPVHIAARAACVALKRAEPGLTLDQVAARVGVHRMTVKRALAYGRLMEAEGLTEPYRELTACPAAASRWRRRTAAS